MQGTFRVKVTLGGGRGGPDKVKSQLIRTKKERKRGRRKGGMMLAQWQLRWL